MPWVGAAEAVLAGDLECDEEGDLEGDLDFNDGGFRDAGDGGCDFCFACGGDFAAAVSWVGAGVGAVDGDSTDGDCTSFFASAPGEDVRARGRTCDSRGTADEVAASSTSFFTCCCDATCSSKDDETGNDSFVCTLNSPLDDINRVSSAASCANESGLKGEDVADLFDADASGDDMSCLSEGKGDSLLSGGEEGILSGDLCGSSSSSLSSAPSASDGGVVVEVI